MEGILKLSDDLTVKIKKLSFQDFMGCDFVPLVFSGVKIEDKKSSADDSYLKNLFEIAITEVISTEYNREIALDFILGNEKYKDLVFRWIHALAFDDQKEAPYLINNKLAVTIYNLAKEFKKLPTEIIEDANRNLGNFNLNLSIMNSGRENNYRNELISQLSALNHTCNGLETTDQLEKLLKAKRDRHGR